MKIKTMISKLHFINKIRENFNKRKLKNRNKILKTNGYSAIELIDKVGKDCKLKPWIEWGTLLGLVREKAIIGHDYDIDFAVKIDSKQDYELFYKSLLNEGFELIRQFKYGDKIVSESYIHNGIISDIDYIDETNDYSILYEYDLEPETKIEKKQGIHYYTNMGGYVYKLPKISLIRDSFKNGVSCFIPERTEEHLSALYGSDWKIPNPNFDWKVLNNYECLGAIEDFTGWRKD